LLSVVIELGTPKHKTMPWTKLTTCLEPILATDIASIHIVNLSIATRKWVKHPGAFLKGPKRSRPHTAKGHVTGMVWSSLVGVWTCLARYRYPFQELTI
jgi:hypothetical protein